MPQVRIPLLGASLGYTRLQLIQFLRVCRSNASRVRMVTNEQYGCASPVGMLATALQFPSRQAKATHPDAGTSSRTGEGELREYRY